MSLLVDFIDRFRTPITIVLVAAILGGSGILLVREAEVNSLTNDLAETNSRTEELTQLQELQTNLNAELAKLRTEYEALAEQAMTKSETPAVAGARSTSQSASADASSDQSEATGTAGLVHLNTADQAQLETLPGIGPSKAKAILDYRAAHSRFASVNELGSVKGIGDKTLEKLRPLVTVD